MNHTLKTNLTLPDTLTKGVQDFALQNNYIRITDAIRYLIGSGLRRESDRGTFLVTTSPKSKLSKGGAV